MRTVEFWQAKQKEANAAMMKLGKASLTHPGKPPVASAFTKHDDWLVRFNAWKKLMHDHQTYLWLEGRDRYYKDRIEAMRRLPRGKRLLHFEVC